MNQVNDNLWINAISIFRNGVINSQSQKDLKQSEQRFKQFMKTAPQWEGQEVRIKYNNAKAIYNNLKTISPKD